jgi:hypothetical protein
MSEEKTDDDGDGNEEDGDDDDDDDDDEGGDKEKDVIMRFGLPKGRVKTTTRDHQDPRPASIDGNILIFVAVNLF